VPGVSLSSYRSLDISRFGLRRLAGSMKIYAQVKMKTLSTRSWHAKPSEAEVRVETADFPPPFAFFLAKLSGFFRRASKELHLIFVSVYIRPFQSQFRRRVTRIAIRVRHCLRSCTKVRTVLNRIDC
jgi:hypothetical protein